MVAPVQINLEHRDVPKQIVADAEAFQKKFLNQLNVNSPTQQIKEGAFKGTNIYNWNREFDGLIVTEVFFNKEKPFSKEIFKSITLIRKNDCVHLGSNWQTSNSSNLPFLVKNYEVNFSQVADRKFDKLSPIKINYLNNLKNESYVDFFNTTLQESLSSKNVTVISNKWRFFCKAENLNNLKMTQNFEYPARPHKIFNIKFTQLESKQKSDSLFVDYSIQLNSGVFGQKLKNLIEKKENEKFDPLFISDNVTKKVQENLTKLDDSNIKILNRFGALVYINKGRAYGLNIGMRLLGPNNEKLHIIQYDPTLENELDAAIAFIRHENSDKPLRNGDVLKLDPSTYPK
jgi:hypothetical protein